MHLFGLFLVGTIGFIGISFFEQVPLLGWLGAAVSIVAWVALGRGAAQVGPSAPVAAAVLGAWTGFVGAVSAWAFQTGNLFGFTTPGLERVGAGLGFVGATLGLVYWPLIGAAVCAGAASFALSRRLA